MNSTSKQNIARPKPVNTPKYSVIELIRKTEAEKANVETTSITD